MSAEQVDVLQRFLDELRTATRDGGHKRRRGEKQPWWIDQSHEPAIFSHIAKWKRGQLVDSDSGAHPLVHAAWRCLAIACQESGNVPRLSPVATVGIGRLEEATDGDQEPEAERPVA